MITVKTTEVKKEPKPFPKLMKSEKGNVVLFIDEDCGTLIIPSPTNSEKTGFYHELWEIGEFVDYNEPITIQNA